VHSRLLQQETGIVVEPEARSELRKLAIAIGQHSLGARAGSLIALNEGVDQWQDQIDRGGGQLRDLNLEQAEGLAVDILPGLEPLDGTTGAML
jgi:hypothetical protein